MNNTVLRLLKIFEEETDENNMLTKNDILDILVAEGYESINEKQFYRKIDELKNNGYDIEIKKGKQTKYFLRKSRLTKEEWIFLLTLILGNCDISSQETKHIIDALEGMNVCWKSLDYAEKYKDKVADKKSRINNLGNFNIILQAIDNHREIEYTELSIEEGKYIFSPRKRMLPVDFYAKNNRIAIEGRNKGEDLCLFLSSMIDVELI